MNEARGDWPPYLTAFEVESLLRNGERLPRPSGWSQDVDADLRLDAQAHQILTAAATRQAATSTQRAQATFEADKAPKSVSPGVRKRTAIALTATCLALAGAIFAGGLGVTSQLDEAREEVESLTTQLEGLQ